MPRAGWVAFGVIGGAALAGTAAAIGLPGGGVAAAGGWVIAATTFAIAFGGRSGDRRALDGRWLTIAIGAVLVAFRLAASPSDAARPAADGAGTWDATVSSVSSSREGAIPSVLSLEVDGAVVEVAASLPPYPVVGAGDRVRVSGDLRAPTTAGERARLFVRSVERAGDSPPIEIVRRAVGDAIARVLPEPGAGLAAGMIVGLRERVDRDLAASFTTAGVSHVVAISGWNVSLVVAFVAPLALRLRRRARAIALIALIVLFVLFAGASASVVRAGAMTGVVLVARAVGRAGSASVALSWAVAALVLVDPGEIGDPGLQLSAAATAGLLAWGGRLSAWLRARVPVIVPDVLVESLALSLAAEAMTLPFVLADFGRLSLVAPAANIAVVPFVAPAMATGALAAIGGLLTSAGAPDLLGVVLALPAWTVLGAMIAIVRVAAGIPFAAVTLPPPVGFGAGIVVALPILWLAMRGTRAESASRVPARPRPPAARAAGTAGTRIGNPGRRVSGRATALAGVVALLAGSLVATVAGVAAHPPGRVRVTALDVGQGDAILVESDRGSRMLIDGGPDPTRLLAALDRHLPPWDRRIDVLVLSHPHEDHAAGLPALVERFRVATVYEPGMRGPGPGYKAFEAELRSRGATAGRLATGDRLALDELDLRVLWPDRGSVPDTPGDDGTSINNVSIVLLGTFGAQRMLLAGDIEQAIDPILLSRRLPRVDLLKVAHHGSPTSSTGPLLDALRPKVAVVSVGAKNPYGHPSPATLRRLRDHGADVYRTDRNGSVEVDLDGAATLVSRERGDADGQPSSSRATGSVPLLACAIAKGPGPAVGATSARGAATAGGYDRPDDQARADAGRLAPPVARSAELGAPACPVGGRGGGLAGTRRRRPGAVRPGRDRGRGAAPRRRQAAAGDGRAPPARTRARERSLARDPRSP